MNEFVEECRREWRRLGVPDPIANEMAADLTADIEEAESEGGSAGGRAREQRVRPSSFRRIVGCRSRRHRAASVRPLRAAGGQPSLLASWGARHFSPWPAASWWGVDRVPLPFLRFVGIGPRSVRVFPGSPIVLQHFQHFPGVAIFALLLLVVGVVGVGLAVLYLAPWNGTRIGPWEIRRYRPRSGVPRG